MHGWCIMTQRFEIVDVNLKKS
nr:unnamed protein product [Callosobruchus chinensis]